jgi:acetylornithine deacetylase/succinyl-diaminopimelate desuccinylase-like protein
MIHRDNAITAIAAALARVGRHEWPTQLPDATREFLAKVAEIVGVQFDESDPQPLLSKIGGMRRMIGAATQHTANPTGLKAGYKVNVIPQVASAELDGRFLPGFEDEFFAKLDELLGSEVTREFIYHDRAVETTADGALWDAMADSLLAEDPDAIVAPYVMSGGTDAKWFDRLGIRCFGFSPLQLTPDLDFSGMFHGIDERVPVSGLQFGVRVLDRLLDKC